MSQNLIQIYPDVHLWCFSYTKSMIQPSGCQSKTIKTIERAFPLLRCSSIFFQIYLTQQTMKQSKNTPARLFYHLYRRRFIFITISRDSSKIALASRTITINTLQDSFNCLMVFDQQPRDYIMDFVQQRHYANECVDI